MARLGGDGTGESHGRYRFVNNTILTGSRAEFRLFDSLESVEMHNNVLHRIDGSGVLVKRTVEALWTTGAEVIAGRNNWVQTGSTQVPAQWTGTVTGADPVFVSLAGNDLVPASGSPLLNAGTGVPQSPPGFPFPSPLFPPAMHPPVRLLLPAGSAALRPPAGAIDIGAFERPPPASARNDVTLPGGPRLGQNYPNPFNPSTRIPFENSMNIYTFSSNSKDSLIKIRKKQLGDWRSALPAPRHYELRLQVSIGLKRAPRAR